MKKFLKRTGKILLWLIGIFLVLFVFLFFAIKTPRFQTWATQQISNYLGDELNTVIKIGGVDIEFPLKMVINELYVEDQEHHEMIHIKQLKVSNFSQDINKNIHFGDVTLYEPHFFLDIHRDSTTSNLQFIVDYFKGVKFKGVKSSNDSPAPIITCDNLTIEDGIFRFNNYNKPDTLQDDLIDFNHLYVNDFDFNATNIYINNDSINTTINQASLIEKSGFAVVNIDGYFAMNSTNMVLQQAAIQTSESDLNGEFELNYKEFTDFRKYNDKVKMNFDIRESMIATNDIAYFTSALKGIDKKVKTSGQVTGKVKNLKGKKLELIVENSTFFTGDIEMNGLPKFQETFISLDIDEFITSKNALERIPIPPFSSGKKINLPDNFVDLGQMKFQGKFTGFIDDFVTYGTLYSNLGTIKSDLSLKATPSGYAYNGNLSTLEFDVGRFYSIPKMGKVNSSVSIKGNGIQLKDVDAKIDGTIQSFYYNGYSYNNILIDGQLRKSFFDGKLNIQDDNLAMDFEGKVDMTSKLPIFSFKADVQNIDFVDLNFINFEKYSSLSAVITSNAQGNSIENIVGEITLEEVSYCLLNKELNIDRIQLVSLLEDGTRSMSLNSSLVSGTLQGKYDFKNIQESMKLIVSDIVPSFEYESSKEHTKQNFSLAVDVHDFDLIQDFFIPEVSIAPDTKLNMAVNEDEHDFSLIMTSDSLNLYKVAMVGVTLDTRRQDSAIYFTLMNDDIIPYNNVHFGEFSLDGRTEKDTLFTALEWNTIQDNHRGELAGRYVIRGLQNIDYYFERSYISVYEDVWKFDQNASINLDSMEIKINNFNVTHLDEKLSVNGMISKDPEKSLDIAFTGIALENINPFFGESSLQIFGNLDGTASVKDAYNEMILLTDMEIFQLQFNEYLVGDLSVLSEWDNNKKQIISRGKLLDGELTPLNFEGFYTPKAKKNPLDVVVDITHLELGFLNEIIPSVVSQIDGSVSGKINVKGKPQKPLFDGVLDFEETNVRLDYLNTTYSIMDQVGIDPDMFRLDNTKVHDEDGNVGYLVGTILHNNFQDWNFDLFLDITETQKRNNGKDAKGFLCLNTDVDDNSLYYGKAYGSGYVGISGDVSNLEFDINLKSEKGTHIALPLGDTEEVSFGNFVTFVDRNSDNQVEEKDKLDLKGISLKFDLEITPDASFKIIFDEAIGDVISGTGIGNVNMLIDTRGKFEMFGQVELLQGDYLFTLQNLIAKEFKVIPGGTIQWFGDPLEANIDLQTIYQVSAPLYDLLGGINENHKSRTQVDLIMNLQGNLMTPEIGFDIQLPNVDEFTKNQTRAALNSEDEINRQAFGLIAMRRFFPSQEISMDGAVQNNGYEFFSNQLSNWLSQISDDFDLGFNYSPGDDISNQEIALALSTQLFNDKLSLSGNFGVSNGTATNQNASSLIGDLRIEYKLGDDGQVKLVVYNKSNDFEFTGTNQNASTQGVGILYQEEFDSMDEFFEGFKNLFTLKSL